MKFTDTLPGRRLVVRYEPRHLKCLYMLGFALLTTSLRSVKVSR